MFLDMGTLLRTTISQHEGEDKVHDREARTNKAEAGDLRPEAWSTLFVCFVFFIGKRVE